MSNARIIIESALRDHAATFKIFDVPPGSMSIMVDAALGRIKSMGPDALAALSIGSAAVTDAVRVGFSAVYGGISEAQKQAELGRREVTAARSGVGGLGEAGRQLAKQSPLAMQEDGRSGRDDRPTSGTYKAKLTSDGSAISFAKQIGVDPIYAGFFSGASTEMRDALRSAIRERTPISEEKVRSMRDVSAVIGAIRTGKLEPDDPRPPPSVKSIIEDMKKKGIDPRNADPKAIQKYLKDNPDALQKAKTQDKADLSTVKKLTPEGAKLEIEAGPKSTKVGKKLEGAATL